MQATAQVEAQWLVSSDNQRVNNHPRWASSQAHPDSSRADTSLSESSALYLGARGLLGVASAKLCQADLPK